MATLPPARVILCGHSMGGLLTAEVALAAPPGRVIGLVSFDVPFLGVHPHVVLRYAVINDSYSGLIR
jgi:pimeloyl-ACP methyl ester carboxylesterase